MQNFRPFPPRVLRNFPGRMDGQVEKRTRLNGWTNGPMYRGYFGFQTDGQPESVMPLAFKGRGIINLKFCDVFYFKPYLTPNKHSTSIFWISLWFSRGETTSYTPLELVLTFCAFPAWCIVPWKPGLRAHSVVSQSSLLGVSCSWSRERIED